MTIVDPRVARLYNLDELWNCGAMGCAMRADISSGTRTQSAQVAVSLRALFKGEKWLRTHTLEGAMLSIDRSGRNES